MSGTCLAATYTRSGPRFPTLAPAAPTGVRSPDATDATRATEAMPPTTIDQRQLLAHAAQLLPDLTAAKDGIHDSADDVVARAFPSDDAGLEPRAIVVRPGDVESLSG